MKIIPTIFNVDFDGTCVTHDYPEIGHDIGSVPVLKKLVANGHKLILFTMRSDAPFQKKDGTICRNGLKDAVKWFADNDIPLYGIQKNPTQHIWSSSPKSYAQIMIDDSALGCPLIFDETLSDRPFVDWVKIEEMLKERNLI